MSTSVHTASKAQCGSCFERETASLLDPHRLQFKVRELEFHFASKWWTLPWLPSIDQM